MTKTLKENTQIVSGKFNGLVKVKKAGNLLLVSVLTEESLNGL